MARPYRAKLKLPSSHCDKDSQWIDEQLQKLPVKHQGKARIAYSDAYKAEFESESVPYKRENKARRSANNRLRAYVKAVLDAIEVAREEQSYKPESNNTSPTGFTGW
jgi:hypothetical protein